MVDKKIATRKINEKEIARTTEATITAHLNGGCRKQISQGPLDIGDESSNRHLLSTKQTDEGCIITILKLQLGVPLIVKKK